MSVNLAEEMKRLVYILLAVALILALGCALINPLIMFLAKRQLRGTFSESQVSLGGCRLRPLGRLEFFEINISRKQFYELRIKTAEINYSLATLLRGNILNVSLKQAKFSVNLPQKNISEFEQYLNLGPPSGLRLNSLELSDIELGVHTKDLNIDSVFSCRLDLAAAAIDYLELKIESLQAAGIKLTNARLNAAAGPSAGHLDIAQLNYGKLKITAIKGETRLSGRELLLEELSAKLLDGQAQGELTFLIEQDAGYSADLQFRNLEIKRFIADFNLKDKFEMNGRLSGRLVLQGHGADIDVLNGGFSSQEPGGTLVIKDTKFLENMARQAKQSLNLLVESFQNYRYNKGLIKLFLEQDNLLLDAALDSEAGKRNLNITLHDFNSHILRKRN